MKKKETILIMGVGNILLGDEGVGIHFINYLKNKDLPDYVSLLDGGTGGFHLLSIMFEYRKLIIIDAAIDNNKPGNVRLIKPKYSKDFPKSLTTHDIGLKDLIDTAIILEKLPEIHLIIITINPQQVVGLELSKEIKQQFPEIEKQVYQAINKIKISSSVY